MKTLLLAFFLIVVSSNSFAQQSKIVGYSNTITGTAWDSLYFGTLSAKDVVVHYISGSSADTLLFAWGNDTTGTSVIRVTAGVFLPLGGQIVSFVRTKSTGGAILRSVTVSRNSNFYK